MTEIVATLGLAAAAAEGAGEVSRGPWWVSLIPFMPLLGTVLCGLLAAMKVRGKLPAWVSVGCLAVSFLVTVAMYASLSGNPTVTHAFRWIDFAWGRGPGQHFTANFAFYIDSLTCLWMLFVTGLAMLIALYASEYMAGDADTAGYARFFAAFNLFVFSMACLVMADNLVLLYLGWEGVGLCSYLLIGYFYKKPSAVAAAKKAFIVNRIGDLGLALGIWLTFVVFGSVRYADLFANPELAGYLALAREGRFAEIPFLVQLIPVLFMVGAFGKSAQFPLYVWLPDAMEGPTPVSALIHAATMVTAGVFLVLRTYPFFLASEWALPAVAWIGGITAVLAATIGMAQFDIKRIMAYSTVSQLGYMFAGLGVLTTVGGAFHVVTHAFFKALLFLACGAVMHGFAGQLDLRKLSGVSWMKGWGIVGATMLVGCLNLAGFPLTGGFFSKDMILAEAFVTPGFWLLGALLLVTAGLTAYYTFRVIFRVFIGPVDFEPGDEVHAHPDPHGHEHAHDPHLAAEPAGTQPSPGPGVQHMHAESVLAEKGTTGRSDLRADSAGDVGSESRPTPFHPHAPGWAINTVLVTLALLALASPVLYFMNAAHHGWVGGMIHDSSAHYESPWAAHGGPAVEGGVHDEHRARAGTFFGMDPHAVMYYVSAVVGLIGIGAAWWLHFQGRTRAATSPRAEEFLARSGPLARWAQRKWYVDELYDYVFVTPLWVLSNIFHLIDKLIVDGLVNLFGWFPRGIGAAVRPSQSGVLHGYALGMAGGIAIILLVVWLRVL